MCINCINLERRSLFKFGAAVAATVATGSLALAAGGPTTNVTADEALARLKAGNERYAAAPELCAADLSGARKSVAKSQTPWATIVSCADSRVPPELLFGGRNVGELFVARNAGNMVDTATMGTLEYGAAVLGVPLVVVLGHKSCGAVAAACDILAKNASFPGSIGPMVREITPAASAVRDRSGDFVTNATRESARRTATKIATESSIIRDLVSGGRVKVVPAFYDLDTGRVDFYA